MKKRFVVAVDKSTPEQDQAFREWVSGSYGWWHWISSMWLIVDLNGILTAMAIRDKVNECYPGVTTFVVEIREDGSTTWSGFGPKAEERNMFTWIRNNWD